MSATERQQHQTNLVGDFFTGLSVLEVLAGRTSASFPREETLAYFATLEAAYGPLAELQAAGQLETGGGTLSPETGEKITCLGALLRLPPGSAEAQSAEEEIRALAEQCLQALLPDKPRHGPANAA